MLLKLFLDYIVKKILGLSMFLFKVFNGSLFELVVKVFRVFKYCLIVVWRIFELFVVIVILIICKILG